jgi:single-strand DNA-binding protein
MSQGFNQCVFVGRVGQDPKVGITSRGGPYARISIATTESWNDGGEWRQATEWVPVTLFGKLADACSAQCAAGDLVYVIGRFTTRKWERDGQKRYSSEIVASQFKVLTAKDAKTQSKNDAPEFDGEGDVPY